MKGKSKEYDNLLSSVEKYMIELEKDGIMSNQSQRKARGLVDMLAVALETYTLLEMGHDKITECYIQSRLVGSGSGGSFASLGGHSIASYGSYTFSPHDSQQIIDDVAQPIL
jgi:ATP-dependent protease HslVU (ClpYQ) peptidase subunit